VSQNRILPLLVSIAACSVAVASDCPTPPVSTVATATCLAEAYVSKGLNSALQMDYQAEELKDYWLVTYSPRDTNVRGGGGKLRIEKLSGRVTFVEGYR